MRYLRSLHRALDTVTAVGKVDTGERGVLLVGARHRGPGRRLWGKGLLPTGPRHSAHPNRSWSDGADDRPQAEPYSPQIRTVSL